MDWNFELDTTYRCNTVCKWCNRLLGVIDLPDSDLTIEQVIYACRRLREMRFYPVRIKFSGGEPELNPLIKEIRRIVKKSLKPQLMWTIQNGIEPIDEPDEADDHIVESPLPKQHHDPILCSPVDAGLEEHQMIHACLARSQTGPIFDAYGFSFCPHAPFMGRLLRINPYSKLPIFDQNEDICRHCPHSLGREGRLKLFEWAKAGNYPSQTYKDALVRWKTDPFEIPRLRVDNKEHGYQLTKKIGEDDVEPLKAGDTFSGAGSVGGPEGRPLAQVVETCDAQDD